MKAGEVTWFRISTKDEEGILHAYAGKGTIEQEDPETFGATGVLHVPGLQELMQMICRQGFEHHVCLVYGDVLDALKESLTRYSGISVHILNQRG
jgi:L-fucose isomerase-like protein